MLYRVLVSRLGKCVMWQCCHGVPVFWESACCFHVVCCCVPPGPSRVSPLAGRGAIRGGASAAAAPSRARGTCGGRTCRCWAARSGTARRPARACPRRPASSPPASCLRPAGRDAATKGAARPARPNAVQQTLLARATDTTAEHD